MEQQMKNHHLSSVQDGNNLVWDCASIQSMKNCTYTSSGSYSHAVHCENNSEHNLTDIVAKRNPCELIQPLK